MNYLSQKIVDLIELNLQRHVEGLNLVSPLQDAFAYSLFPKGKRIRPALALVVAEDLSVGENDRFVNPALALELVHASSLVHDDLPALDNDDYRRGKPACHKAYGEATAILTGDLLISEAFALLVSPGLSDCQITVLTRILVRAFRDVCHGQQRDILNDDRRGPLELLHRLKTGSLFRAAAQFGAVFSNLSEPLLGQVGSLGENIGLLFQVNDDLIDLIGTSEGKGRPTGSDQRNNRKTYGSSYEISDLRQQVIQLTERIQQDFLAIENETNKRCLNTRALCESVANGASVMLGN